MTCSPTATFAPVVPASLVSSALMEPPWKVLSRVGVPTFSEALAESAKLFSTAPSAPAPPLPVRSPVAVPAAPGVLLVVAATPSSSAVPVPGRLV